MKAYVFPGQASQFEGMGKDMYESSEIARNYFDKANEILGFEITEVMFNGSADDLKQTKVTQPAVFLHSVIRAKMADEFNPDVVAGHSLGEFSALVANATLSFEEGLKLVNERALAMQAACEIQESTMAAILGLENEKVEEVCANIQEMVVPANYNCPGQIVISGSIEGINKAVEALKEVGARRALVIPVGGAFHSPLMEPARERLSEAIDKASFNTPRVPIYQNVTAIAEKDPAQIKQNLIKQLTSPVRWTQTMENMLKDGVTSFTEVGGNGKVLTGFVKRVDRSLTTASI
ncbi:MAG: ACP S-malonyltransferase [Bacteroidota bacterium]